MGVPELGLPGLGRPLRETPTFASRSALSWPSTSTQMHLYIWTDSELVAPPCAPPPQIFPKGFPTGQVDGLHPTPGPRP